jgi:DNA end-binding protein Ku
VDRSEVVKGFEYEAGKYAIVDKEDIEQITPEYGKTMDILAFIRKDQIDPIYMDSSYLAWPEKGAEKAYELLLKALEDTRETGLAKFVMHPREYTVFLRARERGLTIHTMFFENEIRKVPGYGEKPKNLQLKPQEIKLAEQLVEDLTEDFRPEKYHDTFQEQLQALVQARQKGKTFVEKNTPRKGAKVIDMMDTLKKSLHKERARLGPKRARGVSRGTKRAAS